MSKFILIKIVLILIMSVALLGQPIKSVGTPNDSSIVNPITKIINNNLYPTRIKSDTIDTLSPVFGTNIDESYSVGSNATLHRTIAEDTTTTSNKISRIWLVNNVLKVEVMLAKDDVNLTIKVYNMLGKEVAEVYNGVQSSSTRIYTHTMTSLPNGVYICCLVGQNFRDTEKFIVSR